MSKFEAFRKTASTLAAVAAESGEFRAREKHAIAVLDQVLTVSEGVDASLRVVFAATYKAVGAPGDWGYGTPEGDAVKNLYSAWNEALKEAAAPAVA